MRNPIRNIISSTPETSDRHRGSALLIVLGFLSFMMISAVSFAVYMRIERQSSSNYRHSVSARHLLNAALYRAIDEIDSELRIEKVKDEDDNRPRKFPRWPGRVKTSAVANGEENARDARVLTLEALSFIPGVLVNDVRRYAIPSETDPGYDADDPAQNWRGAKWRRLSMPVSAIRGEKEKTRVRSEVGRYAYICVNVSDMLDVNLCKAAVRDSSTNRVSIGHLFKNDVDPSKNKDWRKKFDKMFKDTDRHYGSLQDFYACMYQRRKDSDPSTVSTPMEDGQTFATPFGSAYHSFIREQDDEYFDEAYRHILITDSVAMAQPTLGEPCNVLLSANIPVIATLLNQPRSTAVALQTPFADALTEVFKGRLPSGADASGTLIATALADYIDEDSIPKRLNMPTVEMVPMVSQILVPNVIGPTIDVKNAPDWTEADPTKVYFLNLLGDDPGLAQVDVELVWPFKNHRDRTVKPNFMVEVEAYVTPIKRHEEKHSKNLPTSKGDYVRLTGTVTAPDFWTVDTSTDPDKCYQKATVKLTADNPAALSVDMIHSKNGKMNGFEEGQPASVAMVVFVNVREGGASGTIVDRVPQATAYPGSDGVSEDEEFFQISKLYFQTQPTAPVNKTMAVDHKPVAYAWNSLEVPDARFNHKASNWQTVSAGNAITPGLNPSTKALLDKKDGRDGDIYLFVSNAGKMYSPGELGFIIRPCPFKPISPGVPVDFHGSTEIEDEDYMFRTVRLYDHGQPSSATDVDRARDPVYDYFTAADASGKVEGSRVNPLSDIPLVLEAALELTPVNYWYANFGSATQLELNNFNTVLGDPGTLNDTSSDWYKFKSGWYLCLTNASPKLNTSWKVNLSDVYGGWDTFGWYSAGDPKTIFDTNNQVNGAKKPLNTSLYEIDRKMLMSYTLESFSDRQQLFLYIVRAEATAPAFGNSIGGSGEKETKSLAGGSAVALVWRDPYPAGYDKESDNWTKKGLKTWYSKINRVSPWYQHNNDSPNGGKYDDSRDEESDGSEANDLKIDGQRLDGYHPHRILFFKQLDK